MVFSVDEGFPPLRVQARVRNEPVDVALSACFQGCQRFRVVVSP